MTRSFFTLLIALSLTTQACTEGELVTDNDMRQTEDGYQQQARSFVLNSPLEGAVIAADAIEVSGTTAVLDAVSINGVMVPVDQGRFTHMLSLSAGGPYEIRVEGDGESVVRNIVVDRSGPVVTITTPARGATMKIEDGNDIMVSGSAFDPSGLASLTVNGQAITPDAAGHFSASVPASAGVNIIQVEAEDSGGHRSRDARAVIYGKFTPFETPVDDAITLRLERDALRLAGEALGAGINGDLFANLGGAVQEGDFQVRGVTMGATEISLDPGNGVLGIELKVYDLQLDFAANFNGSSIRGDINAHPAIIRLGLRIDTDGLGGLDLQVVSADAEMEDFDFDVNGLLGLFDWVIRGIVRDKLEEGLADALSGQVIANILEADALNQVGELLGHPAAYALALTHIGVDPDGIDITLDAGIDVSSEAGDTLPGYFSHPASAPVGSGDGMIRFGLADDFLNLLLAQVWQISGLRADLGALLDNAEPGAVAIELNAGSVSGLLGAPALLDYAAPDAKVGVVLETLAPPLVQAFGGAHKKVQIDVPEMQLSLSYASGEGFVTWAVVVIHLTIGLTRDADDALQFDIQSVIDVVDAPVFPLSDDTVAGTLGGLFRLIPSLVASGGEGGLLGGLGDLGGLGTVNPGVIVEDFQMRIGGETGGYLNFALDLGVQLLPQEAPTLAIIQTEVSPINGRTYHLLEPSSWTDAEAAALALGGHLATIRNRDEDRWALRTFGEANRENRDLWIGLHDAHREGQWEWSSGEVVDYRNFDRKQPDNGVDEDDGSLNEDYTAIYGRRSGRRDGKWNDAKDVSHAEYNEGFYGLVEVFDPVAPPEDEVENAPDSEEVPQGDG